MALSIIGDSKHHETHSDVDSDNENKPLASPPKLPAASKERL
jgi:hypothetical protein